MSAVPQSISPQGQTRPGPAASPQLAAGAVELEAVFTALPVAVLVLDARGRVSRANPAAAELLGPASRGESWRELVRQRFQPRLDRGELVHRDGRQFSVATHPLGQGPGQVVVLSDVSESRALQQALAHQDRLAGMGRTAASLAHQVRTPLSAALLYAAHLSEGRLPATERERFARRLLERLQHLDQMVRELLLYSRTGSFTCDYVDLARLMREAADSLSDRFAAQSARIDLELERAAPILGNADALHSVLLNLAVNALQARPEGLRLALRLGVESDGWVRLQVADNGPGIPEAVRRQAFEPFFTTRSDGTGLGLAVARAVVESHGGRISLHSSRSGACFQLRFPPAPTPAAERPARSAAGTGQ